HMTRPVSIIIPGSSAPVEAGFIKSLARPGGNVTGFATLELSVIGRILETLKQIAPGTSRVAMIYNPAPPRAGDLSGPSLRDQRRPRFLRRGSHRHISPHRVLRRSCAARGKTGRSTVSAAAEIPNSDQH